MHILDEFHNHDVVIKRLKRIRNERTKVDEVRAADPFRKTFLEKSRDVLGVGIEGGRQHWIRAKMHWFATSDHRREEIHEEIQKSFKLSRNQTVEIQRPPYAVDTMDPAFEFAETSGSYSAEYMSLLKKQDLAVINEPVVACEPACETADNDMDFSVSGPHPVLQIEETQIRKIGLENNSKVNPDLKKSTSELFLSVHNFVQEKEKFSEEKAGITATIEVSEIRLPEIESISTIETSMDESDFAATKLWAQSSDYLPGEKWDPDMQSFEPIPAPRVEEEHEASFMGDASRMIGMLLAKADPALFAADALI